MPLDEKQNILVKMQQEQLEMMSEEEKNLIQEQNLEIVEIEEIEEEIQNENPQKVEFVDFKNDPDAYNKLIFGADYADKQLISSEEEDNNEKTNINNNEDLERTKGEAQQTAKNPNE